MIKRRSLLSASCQFEDQHIRWWFSYPEFVAYLFGNKFVLKTSSGHPLDRRCMYKRILVVFSHELFVVAPTERNAMSLIWQMSHHNRSDSNVISSHFQLGQCLSNRSLIGMSSESCRFGFELLSYHYDVHMNKKYRCKVVSKGSSYDFRGDFVGHSRCGSLSRRVASVFM